MAELPNTKEARISAKSNFTRSVNTLNDLIESMLLLHYEKMKIYWEKLEAAQEEFIDKTDNEYGVASWGSVISSLIYIIVGHVIYI